MRFEGFFEKNCILCVQGCKLVGTVGMADSNIWIDLDKQDLQACTLIIPSVAVGNVGQLACDLLISSLMMKKIASVYSPAVIPILGYDPYSLDSGRISTSCELYKSDDRNLVILQVRAPLLFKYARSFLANVLVKTKEKGVRDVVILSSSFAYEKKHIMTSPFRYVANECCPYKEIIHKLMWLEHERACQSLKIYGGGYASLLYTIVQEQSMPCLLIYKYCSEGDNIPDAYDMVQQLGSILSICKPSPDPYSELVQPVSWKLLFGRPPPQDIY